MIWIPRVLFKFLGPSRKSTGTTATYTETKTKTRTRSPSRSNPLKLASSSNVKHQKLPPSDDHGAPGPRLPPPTIHAYASLRRTFRLWLAAFVIVMAACITNVVVLDVLWVRKKVAAGASMGATTFTYGNGTMAGGTNATNATTTAILGGSSSGGSSSSSGFGGAIDVP
ncbi:hypothetical protein HKX48_001793 [Thoreauomyces humboldtii]|nr:hypothetical protein HKX48_001793 [Thoreauomyces humboldtii]